MCKHRYSSYCSWWCSWRRFVYLLVVLVAFFTLMVTLIGGPDAVWRNMNTGSGTYLSDIRAPQDAG